MARFHLPKQVNAVHAGHANVSQHEISRPILSSQIGKRGEALTEALALVAFEAQDLGKVVADTLFVVDDQNRAG